MRSVCVCVRSYKGFVYQTCRGSKRGKSLFSALCFARFPPWFCPFFHYIYFFLNLFFSASLSVSVFSVCCLCFSLLLFWLVSLIVSLQYTPLFLPFRLSIFLSLLVFVCFLLSLCCVCLSVFFLSSALFLFLYVSYLSLYYSVFPSCSSLCLRLYAPIIYLTPVFSFFCPPVWFWVLLCLVSIYRFLFFVCSLTRFVLSPSFLCRLSLFQPVASLPSPCFCCSARVHKVLWD